MKKAKEVVLGVTGGISAYKACGILRALKRSGFDVSVVMTKEAANFITPLTFQALSGRRVFMNMFDETVERDPKHISLAKRANLIVIAPATANFVAKLANGICDDLLTCICLATRAKIILCPAMNENMYRHKITQENIAKLKKLGLIIIGPVEGRLTSGDIGIGHLAGTEDIAKVIKRNIR
jgi:phosphopantothenoylcysteine synthetase/decarboxylase